jgi:hypothetical protein
MSNHTNLHIIPKDSRNIYSTKQRYTEAKLFKRWADLIERASESISRKRVNTGIIERMKRAVKEERRLTLLGGEPNNGREPDLKSED